MSSNEESEIKNQESEIQNTNQDSITVNTTESKEVNEKIIELVKERHVNDINEGKDQNEIKEEIVEENKSENNDEIKEEKIESKLEIKSINNKTPSKNNSKLSSLSKKNINWKSLYILLNQIYLVINDEPAKHYGLLLL